MPSIRLGAIAAPALALLAIGAAACGGSDDAATSAAATSAPPATSAAAPATTAAPATSVAPATSAEAATSEVEEATSEDDATTEEAATTAEVATTEEAATTEATAVGVAKTSILMGKPKEFSLASADPTLAAGTVTFEVENAGTIKHEAVVVPAPDGLEAITKPDGEAREKGSAGEIVLDAGKSGTFSVDVTPGQWAIICNIPGHFAGGMATLVTVV